MLHWIRSKVGVGRPERVDLIREAEAAAKEGRSAQARQACLAVLRDSPDHLRALCLMATIAADERQVEEGLRWVAQALARDPRSVAAYYARGRLWDGAGRYDEAEASYREVLRLDPTHAKAQTNLGVIHHLRGRLDVALACYRRALELDPEQPEANRNLAAIAGGAGALHAAVEGFKRQIAANPRDAAAYNNLANLYVELGWYQEALANFEQAIALDPESADFHFCRAQVLLLIGNYTEGWKEYEWRWRMSAFNAPMRRFSEPVWDGGPMEGALLIHGETGFGDTVQFVRYAPLAAERGVSVILESQPALKSLLEDVEGISRVVSQGEPLPRFDAHIPLIRLPYVFGTTLETVPWRGPYIRPDPDRGVRWARRIDGSAKLKVGLVWAGNPGNWGDSGRSVALHMLAPLARAQGVAFYSLQKGDAAAQAVSPPAGMALVDLTGEIRDFADTAALISSLDLVITVETAVAHLAGAMGVRTWVLIEHHPNWRWLLDRQDSPWYPTARLFRQAREGDWAGVIERVAEELAELAGPRTPGRRM